MKPLNVDSRQVSAEPASKSSSASHKREQVALRVLRQLIEALLFEQLLDFDYTEQTFYFRLGEYRFKARGKIAAFGRVRLDSQNIVYLNNGKWVCPHALFVVEQLPCTRRVKQQLSEEIQQTLSLCAWNAENLPEQLSRRNSDYCALESQLHEGHPYHPCFKARSGFTIEDHIAYGPECGGKIKLHWLAVRQCYVKNRFSATPLTQNLTKQQQHSDFWQDELGEQTWRLLEHRLAQQGAGWHDYHLVPAHPWQVKKLAAQLKHPLACKDIIDLGQAGDDYQASISVRTLINLSRPEKANIKLPLSMVNT
nr:hypothetical protein [Cellvibrionaceae bacterium]